MSSRAARAARRAAALAEDGAGGDAPARSSPVPVSSTSAGGSPSGSPASSAAAGGGTPTGLSAIEARRQANIRRNMSMLAALKLPGITQALRDASPAAQRAKRKAKELAHPAATRKQSKLPRRRSARVRGIGADGVKLPDRPTFSPLFTPAAPAFHPRKEGVLTMDKAVPEGQDVDDASSAVKELLALNEPFCGSDGEDERKTPGPRATGRTFNFERLSIDERHVVKAVPHRVYSTAMHPTTTKPIAFVGSKWGHVGMWSPHDMHTDEDTGTTVFQPHARPVSGLVVHPTRAACVFSCSYDGSVRALDVTKQVFDEVHIDEDDMFSDLAMSAAGDRLWATCRSGEVVSIDPRAYGTGAKAHVYNLHERKATCAHVNPVNPHQLVTGSLDRTAKVWDVRKLRKQGSKPVHEIVHSLAVTGATFSPDGERVVTTSNDNTLRVTRIDEHAGGMERVVITHNNHTGRWLTPFKAIYDPRNSHHILVGNMTRGVDVFDATTGRSVVTMRSDNLTAVPTRSAVHPTRNWLVSSTASGRLYLWQ